MPYQYDKDFDHSNVPQGTRTDHQSPPDPELCDKPLGNDAREWSNMTTTTTRPPILHEMEHLPDTKSFSTKMEQAAKQPFTLWMCSVNLRRCCGAMQGHNELPEKGQTQN